MNSQAKTENEPYTPTDEEVRVKYRLASGLSAHEAHAEFDRWLAQHAAEGLFVVPLRSGRRLEAKSREALVNALVPKPEHRIFYNTQGGYDCACGERWDWTAAEKADAHFHAAWHLADHLLASGVVTVGEVVTLATPAETDEAWEDPEPYYIVENESRHSVEAYRSWEYESTQYQLAAYRPRTREQYEADQKPAGFTTANKGK